jgi:hypothetical protein
MLGATVNVSGLDSSCSNYQASSARPTKQVCDDSEFFLITASEKQLDDAVSSVAELGQPIKRNYSHATHQQETGSPCPLFQLTRSQ